MGDAVVDLGALAAAGGLAGTVADGAATAGDPGAGVAAGEAGEPVPPAPGADDVPAEAGSGPVEPCARCVVGAGAPRPPATVVVCDGEDSDGADEPDAAPQPAAPMASAPTSPSARAHCAGREVVIRGYPMIWTVPTVSAAMSLLLVQLPMFTVKLRSGWLATPTGMVIGTWVDVCPGASVNEPPVTGT